VTWKFKKPQGITMPDITDAQREALEEANINFLTEEYKKQYVKNGTAVTASSSTCRWARTTSPTT
jgi:hypothetical protein